MSDYKSSVLNCYDEDHDCPTCNFLGGDRTVETLLEVIKNLDHMLAREEKVNRRLLSAIAGDPINVPQR